MNQTDFSLRSCVEVKIIRRERQKKLELFKGQKMNNNLSRHSIADLVEETASALVHIEIFQNQNLVGTGSGFVISSDGLVLTNAHVVDQPSDIILVKSMYGHVLQGFLEIIAPNKDLATLRILAMNLPTINFGNSCEVRTGDMVVAMGSPLGLRNTVTTGVVSNNSRTADELGIDDTDITDYIQTDAALCPGSSGGPLLNLDGEAIGVNCMVTDHPSINLAIPIRHAIEILVRCGFTRRLSSRVYRLLP